MNHTSLMQDVSKTLVAESLIISQRLKQESLQQKCTAFYAAQGP